MTYSGSMMKDLTLRTEQVCEQSDSDQAAEHKWTEQGVRGYLRKLAMRILDKASEPSDPGMANRDFIYEVNRKLGLSQAAQMILEEIDDLGRIVSSARGGGGEKGRDSRIIPMK
jgi:hypothetical protein